MSATDVLKIRRRLIVAKKAVDSVYNAIVDGGENPRWWPLVELGRVSDGLAALVNRLDREA